MRSKALTEAQDPHRGAGFVNKGRGTSCILAQETADAVGADIGGVVNRGWGR